MTRRTNRMQGSTTPSLPKTLTGIRGLDEITNGGLPRGRPTLVCGGAGSGKTLLSMEFLVHGALLYDEPGVFMSFEETRRDLGENVRSLGFDLEGLIRKRKLFIDQVHIDRSEIEEAGDFDLSGLFVRLEHAISTVGAKRVVLDTIEALFSGLPNPAILRAELRRLFRWLREKEMTAIITGESGEKTLTRQGIEEYVSDCVIVLDHRVHDQMSTRRLRVAKYRGSPHGTNEFPFLIDESGFSIVPVTSMHLRHVASSERISSGIEELDAMLGGQGYFRGASVLVSGAAGSGKSSIGAHFAAAACRRGERCLVFLFEESPSQVVRNMRSIGVDLQPHLDAGLLRFHAARPTLTGMEMHLVTMLKAIREFQPRAVVFDPISAFVTAENEADVKMMLMRLVDTLKMDGITSLMVSLTAAGGAVDLEQTDSRISSLIDTWLLLRDLEQDGERNRTLYLLKSRGMAHSNQVREFQLTDEGIRLREVYAGPSGVLTGSARFKQELREQTEARLIIAGGEAKLRELERRRRALRSQIETMEEEWRALESESSAQQTLSGETASFLASDRARVAEQRGSPAEEEKHAKTNQGKTTAGGNRIGSRKRVPVAALHRGTDAKVPGRVR